MGLDAAIDELANVRPDEFVATRDRLAKELRAAGDTEAATALRARRRPNLVAWSVNQVARARPDLVAALFAAADDVRIAVGAGDGDALRTAMRAQRARAAELTEATLEHAAAISDNTAAHRDAIAATWDAAASDEAARGEVAAGLLTAELRPGATIGAFASEPAAGTDASKPKSPKTSLPKSTSRASRLPRDELALKRAEEALAEARHELAEATTTLDAAEEELTHATRAVDRARRDHDRAARRVERAEQSLAERRAR